MRNYQITPSTWLNDDEFIGVATKTSRFSTDGGVNWQTQVGHTAVYGWAKPGKNFFIYTIQDGHIMKIGSMKRSELLDFRSLSV